MDGSDETRKDTEDTTTLVQIEEVKCDIRTLLFVSKLSPVSGRNSHGDGYRVTLRFSFSEGYLLCVSALSLIVSVSVLKRGRISEMWETFP
jgi:hypothetical protein